MAYISCCPAKERITAISGGREGREVRVMREEMEEIIRIIVGRQKKKRWWGWSFWWWKGWCGKQLSDGVMGRHKWYSKRYESDGTVVAGVTEGYSDAGPGDKYKKWELSSARLTAVQLIRLINTIRVPVTHPVAGDAVTVPAAVQVWLARTGERTGPHKTHSEYNEENKQTCILIFRKWEWENKETTNF